MASDFPRRGKLKQIYVQDTRVRLKKLVCPWCGDIYEQPQRLYCGHTLCNSCLQNELECTKTGKGSIKCKICGCVVDEDQIGEDIIARAILEEIRVRCPSKKCTWEGPNKDFEEHYDHNCAHGQRACQSRFEYKYYSTRAEFMRKLNDQEQVQQDRPNMLHPSIKTSLREKLEKEWEVQLRYKDEEFLRKTKRLRNTFGK